MFAASKTAGAVSAEVNYIEDVFSTYLYTGNGSTQTITNGIDLAGNGGLTWIKGRSGASSHCLQDTARGANNYLLSNATDAQANLSGLNFAFNSNGFSLNNNYTFTNDPALTYASWTFRKQKKFFDVVTYTGDGTSSKTVSHSLGSAPAFIVIKRTDNVSDWFCYHTSLGVSNYIILNSTAAAVSATNVWQTPTTTTFGYNAAGFNVSGATYVAYLYASNAGGFGLTGTDNVISCGSVTYSGSGTSATVNLGYEPQWVLFKNTSSATQDWWILDTMRGYAAPTGAANGTGGAAKALWANLSSAESAYTYGGLTSTGFVLPSNFNSGTNTFIYIAIRRGPMKVPTSGTSVFAPVAQNGGNGTGVVTTNFPTDFSMSKLRGFTGSVMAVDRLRGSQVNGPMARLSTADTTAEASNLSYGFGFDNNTGYIDNWYSANPVIYWNFRRAPSFFDEVCYTGTGSGQAINHNLGKLAELVIVKRRNATGNWVVGVLGFGSSMLLLNSTAAAAQIATGTVTPNWDVNQFYVDQGTSNSNDVNASGSTYVAYLFATCAGVSKVFSFTGNGTTQTINCGFAGGARFVLLKASSATGGWYVYDTARGMTTLTDPYLQLNSTAAETATLGSVTTVTTGFAVNEAITTGVNTNGVTYIGIAIA